MPSNLPSSQISAQLEDYINEKRSMHTEFEPPN